MPSGATTNRCERAAAELAEALLPSLRRFLSTSTHEFERLERAFAEEPERLGEESLLHEIEERHAEGHAVGWCLGVLAAAAGTNLLVARREKDGLSVLVRLVQQALADRALDPGPEALPGVSTEHGAGWELPFLVAWLFLRAGTTPGSHSVLRWGLLEHDARHTFLVEFPARRDVGPLAELARLIDGCEPVEEDDAVGFVLPAGHFDTSRRR